MQDATNTTVSAALAAFVAGAEALPTSLLDQGKSALLNVFGTALGSARAPAVEGAARVTGILSGVGEATVIGRSERLRAAEAAFVNAIGMNLLDFDMHRHAQTPGAIDPRRSRGILACQREDAKGKDRERCFVALSHDQQVVAAATRERRLGWTLD